MHEDGWARYMLPVIRQEWQDDQRMGRHSVMIYGPYGGRAVIGTPIFLASGRLGWCREIAEDLGVAPDRLESVTAPSKFPVIRYERTGTRKEVKYTWQDGTPISAEALARICTPGHTRARVTPWVISRYGAPHEDRIVLQVHDAHLNTLVVLHRRYERLLRVIDDESGPSELSLYVTQAGSAQNAGLPAAHFVHAVDPNGQVRFVWAPIVIMDWTTYRSYLSPLLSNA